MDMIFPYLSLTPPGEQDAFILPGFIQVSACLSSAH